MHYFSPKEILIGVSFVVWGAIVAWFLTLSDKTAGDVAVNLISDIAFAIFVVLFVEHANKRDWEYRNRGRSRAVAYAVQKYYQNLVSLLEAFIADSISSSQLLTLPTREMIFARASQHNSESKVTLEFPSQSVPYAAYFACDFTGMSAANVYPPRLAREWIFQLGADVENLYRDVFNLDAGVLPDEVVDSLSALKYTPFIALSRILGTQSIKFSHWCEDDLNSLVWHLAVLQRFFCPILGYKVGASDEVVKNAILNSIARKTSQQP